VEGYNINMSKLYMVNSKFFYRTLEVKEESTVYLYDYSDAIQEAFGICAEYQLFFCEGKRINKISINQAKDNDIQVIDMSLYSLENEVINISFHKYPLVHFNKLRYIGSFSVQDGLRMLLDSPKFSLKFDKDFSVYNENFIQILSKPVSNISELTFNFSVKTETIGINFEGKTYDYEANLKIKIKNLIPKLRFFLNAFDGELVIRDCNLSQRLRETISFQKNRTLYCEIDEVIDRSLTQRGLFKYLSCQNPLCESNHKGYVWLGFGIFDLKKQCYNSKCSNCDRFPVIKFEVVNGKIFNEYKAKGSFVDSNQDLLTNFNPSLWVYFTCICL